MWHFRTAARRGMPALALALTCAATTSGVARADDARVTVDGTAPAGQADTTRTGDAPTDQSLSFAVTLPLRHQADLAQRVAAVTTPGSPQYGQYLTPAQFAAQYGPTDAQVQRVTAFLQSKGVTVESVSANRAVIDATGPVADVQKAFDTRIGHYRDARLRRSYTANDGAVSVPKSIAPSVLGVVGLDDHFARSHPPVPAADAHAGAGPAGGYTPAQLKSAYDIAPLAAQGFTGSGRTIGLFELDGFQQSNITAYDNQYGLGSPAPSVVQIDGGSGALGSGQVEVELDIEVLQAVAPAAKITVWEGPNSSQGVVDTYNAMAVSNTTPANSTSWGLCERNSTSSELASEAQIFSQMAAQGQGLYAASGDSAAYDCGTNGQLAVDNPADDLHVTGVGGTRLNVTASNAYSSETPWDTNATEGGGGGVSTVYAKPSWQTGTPSSCSKRCVPDVSLDADPATGYSIYSKGAWTSVGGTSAAAPMWAAFATVYDQDAVSKGKPALGFAAPTLYGTATSSPSAFHDITTGHTSTATNWPASAGYDLATGIGSYEASTLTAALLGGGTAPPPPANDFGLSASPTAVSATAGSAATSTIATTVTSGSSESVALSASGLPSGATAAFSPASVSSGGSSTLTLSTASTTPTGSYPVTVTGTAATGTHTTTVTLTVTTAPPPPSQLIANGGFETGTAAPWTLSSGVLNNSTQQPPHAGSWDAWLDGYGSSHTDTASQSVTIPASKASTLTFFLHIDTAETTTTTKYDTFTVKLGTTTLATYSNLDKAAGYVQRTVTIPATSAARTVTLTFTGTEDSSQATSFVLDDVSLVPAP